MTIKDWIIYSLGGLVVAGIVSVAFGQHVVMSSISQMINGKAFGKDYSIEGVDEVLNSHDDYGPRKNFWSLVRINDIDMPRRLRVTTRLKPIYLAGNADELPKKEHLEIFMEQRIDGYGKDECEVLKQSLVAECMLVSSTVKPTRDGRFYASMVFAFVQKDPLGKFDTSGTVTYAETEKRLSKPVSYYLANNEGTREVRAKLYEQIRSECDDLRLQMSNCAITEIAVHDSDFSRVGRDRNVKASFTLSYFDTAPNS
ncbi:MAG: hypothetical protein AAGI06_02210 [Pseudomonadota bacterium]